MSTDYYKTLGIDRGASSKDIQKAYRDLARKYHPDMNPGDNSAKTKFQEVQQAYDVLSDDQKRSQYDQFGTGFEQMGGGQNPFGGGGVDLESIFGGMGGSGGFEQFFGFGGGGQRGPRPRQGQDIEAEQDIPFATAVKGGEINVSAMAPDGTRKPLTVKIPAGIKQGKKIKLSGYGQPGQGGGPSGDLIIKINICDHPNYTRSGRDLELEVPITLAEALTGTTIEIPTPYSTIDLKIPSGIQSGKKIRVPKHGVSHKSGRGNLYVTIQIQIPDSIPESVITEIASLKQPSPREKLTW
jgi:DnaJ-class molecular chaperone|tara:strand:+ start:274 stop:1164 length:891 start_codon:yes stop_codon:yes gene_type:complete